MSYLLKDVLKAIAHKDGWLFLSWFDIKSKYRRTVIGPFWIVITTILSIGCIGVVGSVLFKSSIGEYLPYVACGIISWGYFSSLFMESCTVFISNAFSMQNINLNCMTVALRMVVRNTLIFLHSLGVILLCLIIKNGISLTLLLLVPGLLLIIINGVMVAICVGFANARFRDISHIIQALLNITIFITPVMWKPEMLGDYQIISTINPFTHFIAMIREPLLRGVPSYHNILIVLGITTINFIITYYIYNKFRNRLIFWL